MNISMAGIDHVHASVDQRMQFAFTEAAQHRIINYIMKKYKPDGCVLVSTCNRTELWLSGDCDMSMQILCEEAGLEVEKYKNLFTERKGEAAAKYLFELTCGLHSLVFGEDQILTQIRDSLALSREMKCSGALLDKLFSSAVSVGKKVKTKVSFRGANRSVAESGVCLLEKELGELAGIDCVVIGNGEMGRITAKLLVSKGAKVSMTVRQYRHNKVVVPEGCLPIPYEDRMLYIASSDAVISATTSPHLTIKAAKYPVTEKKRILIDLALPRDIDPDIAKIEGSFVYDLDDLGMPAMIDINELYLANEIIAESLKKFTEWFSFRELSLTIDSISEKTARDAASRALHEYKSMDIGELSHEQLFNVIEQASKKAVSSLIYGLKKETESNVTKEIVESLEKSVAQKTGHPSTTSIGANEAPSVEEESSERRMFPMFIDITNKNVLVIGGGAIAARRIKTLLQFGCTIRVIADSLHSDLREIKSSFEWRCRQYKANDTENADIVIAATNDRKVNAAVAEECRRRGVAVNVVDSKEECGFYFPAIVINEDIVAGLNSSGKNPALTKEAAGIVRVALAQEESN